MRNTLVTLLILISLFPELYSRQNSSNIETLNKYFQSFKYQQVIATADSLLQTKNTFTDSETVEIYRIKGVSHFSLMQMQPAFRCFINLLKLDKNYEMDVVQNAPKIVKYFNEVKTAYLENKIDLKEIRDERQKIISEQRRELITTLGYSLLMPGMGHLYKKEKIKGWGLMSAAIMSLSSSVYFIIDTNRKEEAYLNEVEKTKIETKYISYNDSYKYRNISLALLTSIWIYAQVDIIMFDDPIPGKITFYPSTTNNQTAQLNLNISF